MQLKIQKINSEIIKKSEIFFGENFCKNLKKEKFWTYKESLVARYLIEKEKNQIIKKNCWQKAFFSSISHKKNLIFIWTNNSKIWVDIETFKIRDEKLFENFKEKEYRILWWNDIKMSETLDWQKEVKYKNWKNFYILWTAKEAIIKFENFKLDDIWNIILEKKEKIKWIKYNKINFEKKLFFSFKNKKFEVYFWNQNLEICWKKENVYYSICV